MSRINGSTGPLLVSQSLVVSILDLGFEMSSMSTQQELNMFA